MSVLRRLFICLLVVWFGFVGCFVRPQTVFHEPHMTELTIRFDPAFSEPDRMVMIHALPAYERLGIRFVVVEQSFSVFVARWTNTEHNSRIGEWRHEHIVYVDPTHTASKTQLQAIVLHELGHWLGMRHICAGVVEERDDGVVCSPVGSGEAVMNPYLNPDHTTSFTNLDLDEFRRCRIP